MRRQYYSPSYADKSRKSSRFKMKFPAESGFFSKKKRTYKRAFLVRNRFVLQTYFVSDEYNNDVSASLSPDVVDPFVCLLKA